MTNAADGHAAVAATDTPAAARRRGKDAILHSDGLSLAYHTKRGPIVALKDLNLTVKVGEFASIVGPSGCGKSTFLKVTAGLVSPTSGTLEMHGRRITGPQGSIGVVFQKANLLPWKTVRSNAMINAKVLRLDPTVAAKRVDDLLRMVGLENFQENYPWELSGGMQQRVGIVRGLAHDPELLLMDEPFAALDAMTREQLAIDLQEIWSSTGKSIVFITHSIPEAVFLSDRILVMSARPGRIVREILVDLPRPRTLETMATPRFGQLCNDLRQLFSALKAD
jgi:NitT/TauT family transport system ATP-binding protein